MKTEPIISVGVLAITVTLLIAVVTSPVAAVSTATDPFAQGWLAYDSGNYRKAFQIWQELAAGGDDSAQVNVAMMYDLGQGVSEDPAQALK